MQTQTLACTNSLADFATQKKRSKTQLRRVRDGEITEITRGGRKKPRLDGTTADLYPRNTVSFAYAW